MLNFRRVQHAASDLPPEVVARLGPAIDPPEPCYVWSSSAEEQVERHAISSDKEVAGLLGGRVWVSEDGRTLVAVDCAIPAVEAVETSGVHVSFRPEAWDTLSRHISTLAPGSVLVGWFHTHPGLGAFFSSTDLRTQAGAFREPWQIGMVIDPRRGERKAFRGADAVVVDVTRFQRGDIPFFVRQDPLGPVVTRARGSLARTAPGMPVVPMANDGTQDHGGSHPWTRWWLDPLPPKRRSVDPVPTTDRRAALDEAHIIARRRRDDAEPGSEKHRDACAEVARTEVAINGLTEGVDVSDMLTLGGRPRPR